MQTRIFSSSRPGSAKRGFIVAILLTMASTSKGVPIDLTNSTPTVTGATTLHIEGIATLGSSYWADFKWNAGTNKFDVSSYGEEGEPPGFNSYSLEFDDGHEYVDLGTDASLDIGKNGDFSVSLWANWTGEQNAKSIMSMGSDGITPWTVSTGYREQGQDKVGFAAGSNGQYQAWYYNAGEGLNDGNWHHILCVYEAAGPTATIYIDGTAANYSSPGTYNYPEANTIGRNFDGLVDEVAIFSSAISAAEVSDIYNDGSPKDLSASSPDGWWRMGDGDRPIVGTSTPATVTDQAGDNPGTLINEPIYLENAP